MWSGPLSAVVYVPLLQEVPQPLTRASLLRVQEAAMVSLSVFRGWMVGFGMGRLLWWPGAAQDDYLQV